ncbi:MAG: respiratory chain complex I subunit 1 family protein [Saccharofermentanales bacterium]
MVIPIISVGIYLILGPILGGLLAGVDRIITARLQGRIGPPLLQPFYDFIKLIRKEVVVVNHVQDFLVWGFLIFIIFTGGLFFAGGDLLLVFFALTLAGIFFMMSASSANSPYSSMGAQRELLQLMAYEPMILLVAIGFYFSTGSFAVSDIIQSKASSIVFLPGIFIGFVYILTIKLRKSPFDLSTSHHAHQEMVKGLTTEISGHILALVELSHWYENIFLLGIVGLFIVNSTWWSWLIALAGCVVIYFFEIIVDNTFPRVKWEFILKSTWLVTLVAGVINLMILSLI